MFYDLYCALCQGKGEKPSRVADNIGINRSTVSQWKAKYEQGIDITPNSEVLKKISEYFGVSVDYLLGKDEQKENAPALNKRDERDIAKDMEWLRQNLEGGEGLMFDGDPLSDEAKDSILAAMKIGLEMAKVKNKEKYTPKKYRKENNDA
ncbi:MAG: Phage transcriptional regulator, Cro/CI family [Oscillospiraceae bacterium]|nr:Phage transcriptional regulator, Cro/CI family [Oscillospiraceae bacterium]